MRQSGYLYGKKGESHGNGREVEKVMCFCGEDREFGEMACCELHVFGLVSLSLYVIKKERGSTCEEGFHVLLLSCIQDLSLLREVETQKNEVEELRERSSTEKGDIPTNKDDKTKRMATGKLKVMHRTAQ